MANPNDAVGTNGAFGGRTSVNAFNDVLGTFVGRGILSGWVCAPSSGLTVSLGGDGSTRDVAIAEDAAGNKTTINNISQSPVAVTVNAAPASNSRIDAIVAYIEDAPNGSGITDNPDVVNVLVVSGAVASNPVVPNDSAIRAAITADGASGSTAYYVVLATVRISTGTTDIDTTMISQGERAVLRDTAISEGAIGTEQIENGAVTNDKVAWDTVTLGETKNLGLVPGVTVPVTVYNGTNAILTTGSSTFSGGVYLLAMPPVQLGLNSPNYQANICYRIDSGDWVIISDWAHFGTESVVIGQMGFCVPIQIPSGTHTIEIGFGTNTDQKRITLDAAQSISATITKVGY